MASSDKKPTIKLKDVASEAEVSVATVSLALRNHPSITEETRRRVVEARNRLGYRPIRKRDSGPAKQANGTKDASVLSFLYCVVDFPIGKLQYAELLNGVMTACQEKNIRLELRSISSKDFPMGEAFPADIDGVILTGVVEQGLVDQLLRAGTKLVVLGNYNVSNVHTVESDSFRMGEKIAQRILEEGHTQVAHLMRRPQAFYERQFMMGLRDGLASGGIELPDDRVFCVANLTDSVTKTVHEIMNATPRVTAVASNTLNIAEACLSEIRSHSMADENLIPLFYSVSVLPEEPTLRHCRLLDPGMERCGRHAVEQLSQIIENPSSFPYTIVAQIAGWRDG